MRARCLAAIVAVVLMLPTAAASAQFGLMKGSPTSSQPDTALPTQVAPDSPRASIVAFLELARRHDYVRASQYLAVPRRDTVRAAELSRKLKEVLDQRLWIPVERLSPLALGDTSDGMTGTDRIGVIPGASGLPEPVQVTRVRAGRISRWVFDSGTVAHIDEWYADLPDAWIRTRVPAPLLRDGPVGLLYWQWLGIVVVLALAVVLGTLIAMLLKRIIGLITARTSTEWDDLVVGRLRGPFRLWMIGVLATPLFAFLGLNAQAAAFTTASARGVVLVAIFWGLLRIIGLVQDQLLLGAWADGQAQARTLVPLLGRFLRVVLGIVALLVVLSQFGYPVTTLLAGVGIGGVALALASQKTVEHLFGSVSLAADKVFRVGDFVKIGDAEGTVERIGLRSTSLRTLARTVVRIPNGKLAEDRIETFGERDRFVFHHMIGVLYSTKTDQIRAIKAEIEQLLRRQESVWPDQVRVTTEAFGASSIDLRVLAWFNVPDIFAFRELQHEMLLSIKEIVEGNGTEFAFPSRTIYHEYPSGLPTPLAGPPALPDSTSNPNHV